eukprot:gene818-1024_t
MSWTSSKLSKLPDVTYPIWGHTATISGERDIVLFGGFDYSQDKPINTTFILNTAQSNGLTKPHSSGTVPPAMWGHTSTQVGRKMFVFGGNVQDNTQLNDMYQFNTINYSWSKPKPQGDIPLPRFGHTAILVYDSYILVFGGNHKSKPLNDIHIFHTERNSWSKLPTRANSGDSLNDNTNTNTTDECISSANGSPSSPTHHSFLSNSNQTPPLTPTQSTSPIGGNNIPPSFFVSRGRSATISHSSPIVGGGDNIGMSAASIQNNGIRNHHVSATGPTTAGTTTISNLSKSLNSDSLQHSQSSQPDPLSPRIQPTPRYFHSCNLIGSKAYIFGGFDGVQLYNDIYILNVDNLEWTKPMTFGDIPTPRCGHSCISIGPKLFMFGGSIQDPMTNPQCDNDLYVFDTESMVWTLIKANGLIPSPRTGHICLSISSRMLIIGGSEGVLNSKTKLPNNYYVLETLRLEFKSSRTKRNSSSSSSLYSSAPLTPQKTLLIDHQQQNTKSGGTIKDGADNLLFSLQESSAPTTPTSSSTLFSKISQESSSNHNLYQTNNSNNSSNSSNSSLQIPTTTTTTTTSTATTLQNLNQSFEKEGMSSSQTFLGSSKIHSPTGETCTSSCNLRFNILKGHLEETRIQLREEKEKRLRLERELDELKNNSGMMNNNTTSSVVQGNHLTRQAIELYEEIYNLWGFHDRRQRWRDMIEKDANQQLEMIKVKIDQFANLIGMDNISDRNSETEISDCTSDRSKCGNNNNNNTGGVHCDDMADDNSLSESADSFSPKKKDSIIYHGRSSSNPIPLLSSVIKKSNSNQQQQQSNQSQQQLQVPQNSQQQQQQQNQKGSQTTIFKLFKPKKNRISGQFKPVNETTTSSPTSEESMDYSAMKFTSPREDLSNSTSSNSMSNSIGASSINSSSNSFNQSLSNSINQSSSTSNINLANNTSNSNNDLSSSDLVDDGSTDDFEKNKVRKKLGKALKNMINKEKKELEKEKEKHEKERLEKERLEKEKLEKEKLEKERLEKERLEKEKLEKERIEKKQHKKLKLFGAGSKSNKESLPFKREIIEKLINHLEKNHAIDTEGIFRLSGNMDTVRTIVKSFAHEPNLNFEIHNISNALKHYLRLLDPPLIPYEFFLPLLEARKNEDAETIRGIIWKIPPDNRSILTQLAGLLVKISENCEVNRMNSKNLSIVFGPTILKPRTPTLDRMALMTETQLQSGIMQTFVEDFDYIFSENPTSGPKSFLQIDEEESISISSYSTPSSQSPTSSTPPPQSLNHNHHNNNNNTTSTTTTTTTTTSANPNNSDNNNNTEITS